MTPSWIVRTLASGTLVLLLFSCAGLEFGSGRATATGSEERVSKPVEPGNENTKPEQGSSAGPAETLPSSLSTPEPIKASDLEELGNLRFIPVPLDPVSPGPGVGLVSPQLAKAQAEALGPLFKAAYVEALYRGIELKGALGADWVHPWPRSQPVVYVQNWKGAPGAPNSWGIPALILAISDGEGRGVFLVKPPILDYYGLGGGRGGANGVVGYGPPRGNEYPLNGSVAQRFDLGLISVDPQGKGTFTPSKPPSADVVPPSVVGLFEGPVSAPWSPASIAQIFVSAWKRAVDRDIPPDASDGPVRYIPLLPTETGAWKGIFIQTFGNLSWALVLNDGSLSSTGEAGSTVHCVDGPFLKALWYGQSYQLTGSPTPPPAPPSADLVAEDRPWQWAFALYGPPVTEAFVRDGKIVQRFGNGWMEKPVPPLAETLAVPAPVPGTAPGPAPGTGATAGQW